jgi:hypothetical protein
MALDVTGHYARPDCFTLQIHRRGRLAPEHGPS